MLPGLANDDLLMLHSNKATEDRGMEVQRKDVKNLLCNRRLMMMMMMTSMSAVMLLVE